MYRFVLTFHPPKLSITAKSWLQRLAILAEITAFALAQSYWEPILVGVVSCFIIWLTWGSDAAPQSWGECQRIREQLKGSELLLMNITFGFIANMVIIHEHILEGLCIWVLLWLFSHFGVMVRVRRTTFGMINRPKITVAAVENIHYTLSFGAEDYNSVMVDMDNNGKRSHAICLRPSIWEALFVNVSYDMIIHEAVRLMLFPPQNPNQELGAKGVMNASITDDCVGDAGVS